MSDLSRVVWYALACGPSCKWAAHFLKSYPGGVDGIFAHMFEEDESFDGISGRYLKRLNDKDLSRAERVMVDCMSRGVRIVSCLSDEYPAKLKAIEDHPIVLYTRGNIGRLNDRLCVSIVGTRRMTDYGKVATFKLVRELAPFDPVIISGGAYGVDCAANQSALFFGLDTIAVFGTGVDVYYPTEHRHIFDEIAARGMLVSEFPPGTPVDGRNFPIRNRVISGLCDALLVVEAPPKSGALITARLASEQGRRLYAVPGEIFSENAIGTDQMIKEGASLCTNGRDIIDDFLETYNLTADEGIIRSANYQRYEGVFEPGRAGARAMKPVIKAKEQSRRDDRQYEQTPGGTDSAAGQPEPEKSPDRARNEIYREPGNARDEIYRESDKAQDAKRSEPERQPVSGRADTAAAAKNGGFAIDNEARELLREKLGEKEYRVFEAIPDGGTANADELISSGLTSSEILSALTLLELYSAIESLPGGAYRKKF